MMTYTPYAKVQVHTNVHVHVFFNIYLRQPFFGPQRNTQTRLCIHAVHGQQPVMFA